MALTDASFSSETWNNSFHSPIVWVIIDGSTVEWTGLSQDYPFPHFTETYFDATLFAREGFLLICWIIKLNYIF